jgi:hypothetical protein
MGSPGSDIKSQASAIQVLTNYYSAFSTLEVRAILPYFHEPALLIGPQGVFAATTSAEVTAAFKPAMEGLRAKRIWSE